MLYIKEQLDALIKVFPKDEGLYEVTVCPAQEIDARKEMIIKAFNELRQPSVHKAESCDVIGCRLCGVE